MPTTMIVGATGSGKTEALRRRYYEWVKGGVRTDQVLVLTAGAAHTSRWRREIDLPAHGPVEAHSFFGFIQRELNLFWAPVQAAVPPLRHWVRPEFLNVEIAHHLMRGLVEPLELLFSSVVKASPQRIAIQIASNLSTVGSATGLSPEEMVRRLAAADRGEKGPAYDSVQRLIEVYRERCLNAGVLDYGLALHLFTGVLMQHGPYMDHLRNRYRCLLVDDLDESVPAEQDFLAALSGQMEQTVYAFNPGGGHTVFMGADPVNAYTRFKEGATMVELPGSHTCTPELFAFGEALAQRVTGARPERRFTDVVEERIATDLRGDMVQAVVERVLALVDRGVPPGEIAVISPHVDKALEVTARRAFAARPRPVAVQNLSFSRRLVDEPYARATITLAGLVHPQWRIPRESAGFIANAMQLLLKLDPVRASVLGNAIWRADGELPDLDQLGLRRRIGFERAEAYDYLRSWVAEARQREWETDGFAQAVIIEVMAPLIGHLTMEQLHACQQLLLTATRFRKAMERFGEGAYGREYIKMLTEGTVAAEPLDAYDPARDAVTLATPFGFLSSRLTAQVQVWVDISSDAWYPNDAKELANPHVLSRHWEEGSRWTDSRATRLREANAARTARALVRRCTGRLILAECSLSPWGQEQEGRLAAAFADLVVERGRRP
ncbi:MAG: UvrD-helicase domain-containing protein [Bacillota bacterium]